MIKIEHFNILLPLLFVIFVDISIDYIFQYFNSGTFI